MASQSGTGKVSPADFPPPVEVGKEFVKRSLDGEDERIEIGVAIVGGGTAGLACANRLLQLLADDPETMERLGEVPVAVIEKAKTCGGHNLSGAVMRPGPLQELFPDLSREQWRQEGFAFGEVEKEAIYLLPNGKRKLRIPPPPPQRNHGNEVISVSALCRYMQAQAEEAGAYLLTETAATQLIVEDGAVVGVRSGDKGRGKDGEELGNFEPGTDIAAKATVLAEGCWGHLTDAAVREFDLDEGREPQVWELGVKEVWKVKKPLDRVIHTLAGWPLKISARYHQIGGSWIYPMKDEKTGEDLVSIGWVLDLDYADATTSAHDLLQQFKTHPLVRDILEGGERVSWGAKAIPAGGYWAMPKLSAPGAVLVGDAAGMINLAALKGVHYAIKAGMLAAESIYAALKAGQRTTSPPTRRRSRTRSSARTSTNSATPASPSRRACSKAVPLVNLMIATKGRFPGGRWKIHRNDAQPMFVGKTKDGYPTAGRQVHLRQALQRLHQRQRDPRRRAQPHPRAEAGAAGDRRDLGLDVPGRRLRDPRGRARERRRRRDRQLHQLRPVRRDHRQGRSPDPARGRRRPALPEHLASERSRAMNHSPADGKRIAFVQSSWHEEIVDVCRTSFMTEIERLGVAASQVDRFEVTGAFEIPLHAKKLAASGHYGAIVAAGLVVDGGIYRHEFVAEAVIGGLMRVQLDSGVPVISAVLTPHHFHEHEAHATFFSSHFEVKGREAARACAHTVEALDRLPAAA